MTTDRWYTLKVSRRNNLRSEFNALERSRDWFCVTWKLADWQRYLLIYDKQRLHARYSLNWSPGSFGEFAKVSTRKISWARLLSLKPVIRWDAPSKLFDGFGAGILSSEKFIQFYKLSRFSWFFLNQTVFCKKILLLKNFHFLLCFYVFFLQKMTIKKDF